MTEPQDEDREPTTAERIQRNAPRVEQLARWLWDHRPQTRKGKAQLVAVVGITVVGFGLGALTGHGPAAKPASVTHSNRPAAVRTPDPTPAVSQSSSWTPGPAPGYGFVGGNPGDTGTTTVTTPSASASPSTTPPIPPEPSPTETTIQPGPAPTTPSTNPSE